MRNTIARKILKIMPYLILVLLVFTTMTLIFKYGFTEKITEGEVYKKEYREAYTTTQILPLITSNGTSTSTTMIPYVVRYPDRYVISIKTFKDNEWITKDFYVSQEVYNNTNIGDMFSFDKKRGDLENEPYTKERQ